MTKKKVFLEFGGCMALLRISINKPALLQHILELYELRMSDMALDKAKKEIEGLKKGIVREVYGVLFGMLIDNKHISIVQVGTYWLDCLKGIDMVWADNYKDIHSATLHGGGLIYTWEVLDELMKKRVITEDQKSDLLMEIYGRGVKLPNRNFGEYDMPDDDFKRSMPNVLPLKVV